MYRRLMWGGEFRGLEALDLTTRTRDLSLRELPPLLDPKVWFMTHNLPNSARPDPLAISSRLPQSRLL